MHVKRVDPNFKARRNRPWPGFINPHKYLGQKCKTCKGDGYSDFGRLLKQKWYGEAPFDPAETGSKPFPPNHPAFARNAENNARFWVSHFSDRIYGFANFWFCPECGEHFIYTKGQPLAFCTNHPLMVQMVLASAGQLPFEAALAYEQNRLAGLMNGAWQHHLDADDVRALIDGGRLWDFTRRPLNAQQAADRGDKPWLSYENGYIPTPEEVNVWSVSGGGHDSINSMICIRARCNRAGKTIECPDCGGSGTFWKDKAAQAQYEAWEPSDPPAGESYQLWEANTPKSRVYKTSRWLARFAVKTGLFTFADHTATEAEWKEMIEAGFIRHEEIINGQKVIMFGD